MAIQIFKASLVAAEKAAEGLMLFKSSLVSAETGPERLMLFKSSLVAAEMEMTDTPRRQPMIGTF